MSRALHTSRRTFSARTTLAAAVLAVACGGCAFDQSLAGLGNIFGAPAEAKTAGNAQGGRLAAAKRAVAAGADAKALGQELSNVIDNCPFEAPPFLSEEDCACLARAYTPAAAEDTLEAVRFLLDNGANVNQKKGDNYEEGYGTPLLKTLGLLAQMNSSCGYEDMGINTKDNIATASEGISKIATLLVSRGANFKNSSIDYGPPTARGSFADPLVIAAKYGNADLVRILIEKGADVEGGECPVHAMIGRGSRTCSSVLELAAEKGNAEIVKLLLEKGAKKGRKNALETAQSSLKYAETEAEKAQYREIISLLKAAGGKKASAKKRK